MQPEAPVITDNKSEHGAPARHDRTSTDLADARKRLTELYQRVEQEGGWRAVAREIGSSNVQYVYNFAMHGVLPANVRERARLLRWRPRRKPSQGPNWIDYPSHLEAAILRVLGRRVGRLQAIGRNELVTALSGYRARERTVREAIKQLRRQGHLICAMPGQDGGYYLAGSLEEFEEFDRLELGAKIADMSETREAMRRAARERFGEGFQMKLMQ